VAQAIEPIRKIDEFSRVPRVPGEATAARAFATMTDAPASIAAHAPPPHALGLALAQAAPPARAPQTVPAPGGAELVVPMRGGTLSPAALRDFAQDALRRHANQFEKTPARFVGAAEEIAAADLPSRNLATSRATLRMSALAVDEWRNTTAVDLHLARRGASLWEAALFERAGAPDRGHFPYAAPPIVVANIPFDAIRGQFVVASDRKQLPATIAKSGVARRAAGLGPLRLCVLLVGAAAGLLLAAGDHIIPAAVCFLSLLAGVVLLRRGPPS
jgi:hypothetical protein